MENEKPRGGWMEFEYLMIRNRESRKTTSLLNKLEAEIEAGVKPRTIGFVSFTRRAIKESRERTITRFDINEETDLDYFRTLHSICFRSLGLNGEQIFKGSHITEFKKLLKSFKLLTFLLIFYCLFLKVVY